MFSIFFLTLPNLDDTNASTELQNSTDELSIDMIVWARGIAFLNPLLGIRSTKKLYNQFYFLQSSIFPFPGLFRFKNLNYFQAPGSGCAYFFYPLLMCL